MSELVVTRYRERKEVRNRFAGEYSYYLDEWLFERVVWWKPTTWFGGSWWCLGQKVWCRHTFNCELCRQRCEGEWAIVDYGVARWWCIYCATKRERIKALDDNRTAGGGE